MARNVFFSFHYDRDIWRVNQIRNTHNITGFGRTGVGFRDYSLWEEKKKDSQAAIRRDIVTNIEKTTVTVVCIGAETASRPWVSFEIEETLRQGHGLIGVTINHLMSGRNRETDLFPLVPSRIREAGYKVYRYTDVDALANYVEEAYRLSQKKAPVSAGLLGHSSSVFSPPPPGVPTSRSIFDTSVFRRPSSLPSTLSAAYAAEALRRSLGSPVENPFRASARPPTSASPSAAPGLTEAQRALALALLAARDPKKR